MSIEHVPIQRDTIKLPDTTEGLSGVIEGLELYPNDEGTGFEILRHVKSHIESALIQQKIDYDVVERLKKGFDNKMVTLVLKQASKLVFSKNSANRGLGNDTDVENMTRMMKVIKGLDAADVPLFDEANREVMNHKIDALSWEGGIQITDDNM